PEPSDDDDFTGGALRRIQPGPPVAIPRRDASRANAVVDAPPIFRTRTVAEIGRDRSGGDGMGSLPRSFTATAYATLRPGQFSRAGARGFDDDDDGDRGGRAATGATAAPVRGSARLANKRSSVLRRSSSFPELARDENGFDDEDGGRGGARKGWAGDDVGVAAASRRPTVTGAGDYGDDDDGAGGGRARLRPALKPSRTATPSEIRVADEAEEEAQRRRRRQQRGGPGGGGGAVPVRARVMGSGKQVVTQVPQSAGFDGLVRALETGGLGAGRVGAVRRRDGGGGLITVADDEDWQLCVDEAEGARVVLEVEEAGRG
ncbi:hypothetical protein HK405_016064, partial [Cladochytrium tenue]